MSLDRAAYHSVTMESIPPGYRSVPVNNGKEFDTTMVAGSVGIQSSENGKALGAGTFGVDTMQPVTGWWMFQKKLSVRKPALVDLCSMLAL